MAVELHHARSLQRLSISSPMISITVDERWASECQAPAAAFIAPPTQPQFHCEFVFRFLASPRGLRSFNMPPPILAPTQEACPERFASCLRKRARQQSEPAKAGIGLLGFASRAADVLALFLLVC